MSASPIYIAISIAALGIIALSLVLGRRGGKEKRLTPLAGVAFALVVAGLVFGGDRLVGYSLLGIGVILAVVDMWRGSRSA